MQEQYKRCGGMHGKNCPAVGQTCKKCGKRDHFARMCFTSKKKVHEINDFKDSSEDESDEFFVYTMEDPKADKADEWFTHLKTNGTEIQYKLDTGSQVNIITEQLFNKFTHSNHRSQCLQQIRTGQESVYG